MLEKPKRIEDPKLIKQVKGQKCVCCGICPEGGVDAHHVTSRGAGGDDTVDNLLPVCRIHHAAIHHYGWSKSIRKYHGVYRWLLEHERHDILSLVDEL